MHPDRGQELFSLLRMGFVVKSSELKGQRVTIKVNETPCRVTLPGSDYEPLTKTTTGVIERFVNMPAGPIGFLHADDGSKVAFDAGCDITVGKIEIELHTH